MNIEQTAPAPKPRPFRPFRNMIAKLRRRGVVWVFRARRYWLGPEAANVMFLTITHDLVAPLMRANGIIMGERCDINSPLIFHNLSHVRDGMRVMAYDQLEMGERCHVGRDCFFDLRDRIVFGNRVVVAMRCTFITHIDVGASELKAIYPSAKAPIYIGDDTYIGVGTTILRGVTLGQRCLVAAGSVVTKSFGDNSLIGGIPAKLIKQIPAEPESTVTQ